MNCETACSRDACPKKIIRFRHSDFIERTKRSANAFKFGDRGGRRIRRMPSRSSALRNSSEYFVSRSSIKYRHSRRGRGMQKLRNGRASFRKMRGLRLLAFSSRYSRAIASNVSERAACSACRFALGSTFGAISRRASSRGSRAVLSGTPGYWPKLISFSRPSTLYFIRHSRAPLGFTSRYRPPPSNSLQAFSPGLMLRIAVSVSGGVLGVPFQARRRVPPAVPPKHGPLSTDR